MLTLRIQLTILFVPLLFLFGFVGQARADYYAQGMVESKNLLSGATVTAINSFQVVASVPANTTVSIKFSQDRVNYYNSSGTKEGYDTVLNGTTNIDLSSRGWTGAILFYKLKLTSTDVAVTPTVSEVSVDYNGTTVPAMSGTVYFGQGIVTSTNLLVGSTVTAINSFQVVASVPAGTTVSIKFSQDQVNYYNSSGTKDAWNTITNGTVNVDLSGLGWSGGALFYKVRFESLIDEAILSSISEVSVDYTGNGGVAPGGPYYVEAAIVSTDLLSGTGETFDGSERFGYEISSLPYGTSVQAQFSQNGTDFYSSNGTLWGWDTLVTGRHLTKETALDLLPLGWKGAGSFYYKLRLTTTVDNTTTPAVAVAGLMRSATVLNSSDAPNGSIVHINSVQTGQMTSGLLGVWGFDGPDWNLATGIMLDRSSFGHNGTVVGASVIEGRNGQALDFDGTNDVVTVGNVGSGIKTIAFWMKADDITSRKIMDFDGTKQLELNGASTVLATGFPAATVYIDGALGATVSNSDWHHVAITDTTGIAGSAVDFGRVGASYFDGRLDEIRFYDRVYTPTEIQSLFRLGRATIKR